MNTSLSRRAILVGAALAAATQGVLAQPAQPVKLVVPFSAGGTADVLPRILAEKMRSAFPAGLIVENKPGAGGNIGADLVARSPADGTTYLVSPPGPIVINNHLYKSLPFDPTKFEPVTVVATSPNVLAVRSNFPAKSLQEFIAYAKANPGKVSYASQGNGSTSHLTAAMFMQMTGIQMIHVPYKGTAPALVDLIGGQVDVFFDNISSSAQYHISNKVRVLAVADAKRSRALPDVQTMTEQGLKMEAVTFFSMVAPANTPKDVVAHAYKAVSAALALPDVKQRFQEQGAEPGGQSPEQTAQFFRAESDKWRKVIQSANVKVE